MENFDNSGKKNNNLEISISPSIDLGSMQESNPLTTEELDMYDPDEQIEVIRLKKIYNEKQKEIHNIKREIFEKDEEIALLLKLSNINHNICPLTNDTDNNYTIGDLKKELEKLNISYNEEVKNISNEHEQNLNKLKNEINFYKEQINYHQNLNEFISKETHEKYINELRLKHNAELQPFKNELDEISEFLKDNCETPDDSNSIK